MKMALLAAAAMIATPLMAQTAPQTTPPADQSTMTPPATPSTSGVDPTAAASSPSTMSTTTPPADPNAAMAPPAASTTAPMTTDSAAPMPAAGGKLPWCRPGQYTGCRERENAQGKGLRKN